MAANLNGAEPIEQIINTLLTEGPMWNLSKHYTILYMYIAQTQL